MIKQKKQQNSKRLIRQPSLLAQGAVNVEEPSSDLPDSATQQRRYEAPAKAGLACFSEPIAIPPQVDVLGVQVSVLTVSDLYQQIAATIHQQQKRLVLHVNVYAMNLSSKHKWLREFINQAPIVFCDGYGVVLGARLLGHPIPERMTGADWVWPLAEFAEENGFSIFCLGTKEEIIEKAVERLQEAYPSLKLMSHHGYFDKKVGSAENQQVIELINKARPDILLVGFGMPIQERWLRDNWSDIDARVGITVGAMFDYVSGDLQRAPSWMLKMNMEWLGRWFIEPRRLAGRYLLGNPLFMWRIFRELLTRRFGPG